MKHIILLHYYCEAEIERYLQIAEFLREYSRCRADYEFLLLAASCISPSQVLQDAYSKIAPAKTLSGQKTMNGHLAGANAAFWEGMEYINNNYEKDGGFVFWLESDMLPIKKNWVDLLELEWKKHPGILVMGLYIPWLIDPRVECNLITPHINGGGCYVKYLDSIIPISYKNPAFDMHLSRYAMKVRKFHKSGQFVFTDKYELCYDISNPKITILHGLEQDHNQFISGTINLLRNPDFIKKEIEIIEQLPTDKKICCKFWNPCVKLCMIHDCVRHPFKRILFLFDKIFLFKVFPVLNMFRKR